MLQASMASDAQWLNNQEAAKRIEVPMPPRPRSGSITLAVSFYSLLLLRAYPAAFRRRFGAQMRDVFADRCAAVHRERGAAGVLALCAGATADELVSAWAARVDAWRERRRSRRLHTPVTRGGSSAIERIRMSVREFRHAVRSLLTSPLFSTTAVVTVALGVGATTAVFSVVNGVLLKPLPFEDPERLVSLLHEAPGAGLEMMLQSPTTYFTYRDQHRVFEDIGLWRDREVSVTGLDAPERVAAVQVSDGTLPVLGVPPLIGRTFTREDDTPGAPLTAVLAYGYWQRRFGGDPGVLGRTLMVDSRSYEIIGVMPANLRFLRSDPAMYLPFQIDRSRQFVGNFSYRGMARLRPGVTIADAGADIERMIPLVKEEFTRGLSLATLREMQFGPMVRPLESEVVGDVGNVLWVLLGTVGVVLLIACANVANLMLVRAENRQREVAIRTALGAGRRQIAATFLMESAALGIAGGLVGLGLAWLGLRVLVAMGPETLPRLDEIGVDGSVLLFTLGVSLLAGLLFGLVPLLRYGNPNLVMSLKEGGRGGGAGVERHRARNGLVVSQVALAVVLVISSGLMIRSFQALRRVFPGFQRPEEVLVVQVSIPYAMVGDNEAAAAMHERILRRVQQLPGVTAAALTTRVPMRSGGVSDFTPVEGFPVAPNQRPPSRRYKWISPGYFATMGNPVVAGRPLTWADIHTRAPVVVVTENFAREYWDEPAAALGNRVRDTGDGPWREIVGVVGNVYADGIQEGPVATMYWPMVQRDFWGSPIFMERSMEYAIRSVRVGASGFLDEVRRAVWSESPDLPVANVRTMKEVWDGSMARTSFTLVMLAIAASVALLLGAVGIYGVIAYVVSQRTREIGVRMALGARDHDVSRMVLRQGILLAAAGVGIGLLAASGLTRLMAALLYGVDPVDPATYTVVSLGLAAVALAASYLPARRAARVDPAAALRSE